MDKASVADVRKVSIVCTSLVIERLREVNNASKSCCMWSSIVDLTGDVDTLIQSTLMFLSEREEMKASHTFKVQGLKLIVSRSPPFSPWETLT